MGFHKPYCLLNIRKERNHPLVKKWHCQDLAELFHSWSPMWLLSISSFLKQHLGKRAEEALLGHWQYSFPGGGRDYMGIYNYSLNFMQSSICISHNITICESGSASMQRPTYVDFDFAKVPEAHLAHSTKVGR